MATMKSLEALLDESEPATEHPDEHESGTVILVDRERCAQAYELKMKGVPVKNIAGRFGVDQSTVYRWIRQHIEEFRKELEHEPAANLVAESLLWYSRIEEMCLYEYAQMEYDLGKVDPETGGVRKRVLSIQETGIRLKYLQSAMRARESKNELLARTGVLPKEPERIYHAMIDEKRLDMTEEVKASHRTKEEIGANIIKLLEKGRTL